MYFWINGLEIFLKSLWIPFLLYMFLIWLNKLIILHNNNLEYEERIEDLKERCYKIIKEAK